MLRSSQFFLLLVSIHKNLTFKHMCFLKIYSAGPMVVLASWVCTRLTLHSAPIDMSGNFLVHMPERWIFLPFQGILCTFRLKKNYKKNMGQGGRPNFVSPQKGSKTLGITFEGLGEMFSIQITPASL
jgi:hypothetical protein